MPSPTDSNTADNASPNAGVNVQTDIHDADKSIKVNLTTQLVIYGVLIVCFLFLRRRFRLFFSTNPRKRRMHPAYNHTGLLNWLVPVFRMTDTEMININGLDSYVMLSLFKMLSLILLSVFLLVSLPLAVVYAFPSFNPAELYFTFCVRNNGTRLAKLCAFAATLLTTGIVLYFLFTFSRSFISLRQAYIRNPATMHPIADLKRRSVGSINVRAKTVLLTRLPNYLETNGELREYVEALGLGEQKESMIVKDTRKYNALVRKKRKIVLKIEEEIYAIYRARVRAARGGAHDGVHDAAHEQSRMHNRANDRTNDQANNQANDGHGDSDVSSIEKEGINNDRLFPLPKKVRLLKRILADKSHAKLQKLLDDLNEAMEMIKDELNKLNEEGNEKKNITEMVQDEYYQYEELESFKSAESDDRASEGRERNSDESKENKRDRHNKGSKNTKSGTATDASRATATGTATHDRSTATHDRTTATGTDTHDRTTHEINHVDDHAHGRARDGVNECLGHVLPKSFALDIPLRTKCGIVTFKHQRSASILCQSLISSKLFSVRAEPAPGARDINYDNLNTNTNVIIFRRILAFFIFVVFTFVFFYLVSMIASLLNLRYLEGRIPWLANFLREHRGWRATLQGILSPLAYNVLMAVSPIFIRQIISLESNYSSTTDQISVMRKYSLFLLLNGFLAFVTTYSVREFSSIDGLKKLLEEIDEGLLRTSVFFVNALIQKVLVGQAMLLLQVGTLVTKILVYLFTKKTLRIRKRLSSPVVIDFSTLYPNMLLIFAICLIYSLLTPLIILPGLLFYVSSFVLFKTEFIYNIKNEKESGGLHFNFAATYIVYILLFFQFLTAIQFLSDGHSNLFFLVVVLLVLTYFFKQSLLASFNRACTYYPLSVQEEHYVDAFTRRLLLSRVKFVKRWVEQENDERVEMGELGMGEIGKGYEKMGEEGIYLDVDVYRELDNMYGD